MLGHINVADKLENLVGRISWEYLETRKCDY